MSQVARSNEGSELDLYRMAFVGGDREALRAEDSSAVVYVGERVAAGFQGRRRSPSFNYSFLSNGSRDRYVEEFFDRVATNERAAAERRAMKFSHDFKVGDVVHTSWGYEQTNVEFYKVVATTKATVTLVQIGSKSVGATGPFSEKVEPDPEMTVGEPERRHVTKDGLVSFGNNFRYGHKYNGGSLHSSWGH